MTKFKKFLASLLSCCLALVLVIAAGCSAPEDSSDSSSASTSSSEETSSSSSATSSSEAESSSSTTSSSEASSSETSSSEASSSETSSSEASSSETSSSETSSSEADTSDDDDYTLTSTTVYFVGDSTVCSFNDYYYYPRYGYGTQFYNYIDTNYVSVVNLALSGRSSKSFIEEDNYDTLTSSIKEGDYLIIGFGHNDEKYDEEARYTAPTLDAVDTEGSFQYYLYNYYIKVAEDIGATPILCTPIVRANESDNYSGSSGHVVTGYGDYAACIRDLAEDKGITCIDLTAKTKTLYESIGYNEAIYYHAWKKTSSTSVDKTHLNIYGAKNVAYMIASELQSARKTCNLGYYVLNNISEPTKENDLVSLETYVEPEYNGFTSASASTLWSITSDGWYGTVFGDVGSQDNITTDKYTVTETTAADSTGLSFTIGTSQKIGKIASSADGLAMTFMQISIEDNFTLTATATIQSTTSTNTQQAFGLMLRDDIYIDTYSSAISSNYVTAGAYVSSAGSNLLYYRENGSLKTTKNTISAFTTGSTYELSITRTGQTVVTTLTYGETTYSYTHTDFDFEAVDNNYFYLGLFATRQTIVDFSNVVYTYTGQSLGA